MTPRILTLTPHESLAVALTMAAEDWDIVHEPVAVVDLSTIAVALIDAPTTAEAEATLQDLRERGFTGPAVLSGDEPRDSGDVFVRPYDVGDLRGILRERAGLARVDQHASSPRPRREKRPKRGRRDRGSDSSFTADTPPPPTTLPPPPLGLEPAEAAPADDPKPGGDGTRRWQRKGRLASASAPPSAPEPDLASDEEAPAMPSPPTTPEPDDEPGLNRDGTDPSDTVEVAGGDALEGLIDTSPNGFVDMVTNIDIDEDPAVLALPDDDLATDPASDPSPESSLAFDPEPGEAATADPSDVAMVGHPPEVDEAPGGTASTPEPEVADAVDDGFHDAQEGGAQDADAGGSGTSIEPESPPDDDPEPRVDLTRLAPPQLPVATPPPPPTAAVPASAAADDEEPEEDALAPLGDAASDTPSRRRLGRPRRMRPARVARDVDAASLAVEDVSDLLDRVPRAAELPAVAAAVAEEVAEVLGAQTVAVWVREDGGYRVRGGVGLGAMESRLRASDDHPFLGRITTNRHAVLVHPMDDIRGMLGGMAGARGETLLAAPVIRKKQVLAIVTAALDREGRQRDLDRLVAVAEESAPLIALAGQLTRLTAT